MGILRGRGEGSGDERERGWEGALCMVRLLRVLGGGIGTVCVERKGVWGGSFAGIVVEYGVDGIEVWV